MKHDLYIETTQTIIDLMKQHGTGWTEPWVATGVPMNATTGRAYTGMNVLLFGLQASAKGYETGQWATYKQWQAHGSQVRKGERSVEGMFFKRIVTEDKTTGETKSFPMLRGFSVFNIAQVDAGDDARPVKGGALDDMSGAERIDAVENWITCTDAMIVEKDSGRAFYSPAHDVINIPHAKAFRDTESFYATKLHELVHWTGAPHRCNRDFSGRFGSEAYAFEELVAEIGAAMLCQQHAITSEVRADHAKYLNNWIKVLKDDKKAIFTASARAQDACVHLNEYQKTHDALKEWSLGA